jgi:ATP-dependent Lhr-like helicase
VPLISPEAVDGLKFSAALPRKLAVETLGERFADRGGAAAIAIGRRIECRSRIA